jgi:MFS superfamily sulfate permease-like transporter
VGTAYALASGVPGIYGLYATIVLVVTYALFGPSRIGEQEHTVNGSASRRALRLRDASAESVNSARVDYCASLALPMAASGVDRFVYPPR